MPALTASSSPRHHGSTRQASFNHVPRELPGFFAFHADDAPAGESLAELVDEGFIVDPVPIAAAFNAKTIDVLHPDGEGTSAAIVVEAGTRFELTQAALRIGDFLAMHPQLQELPLFASNPIVAHRAAGFRGGGFEVDFAQGTQEEWLHHHKLSRLAFSTSWVTDRFQTRTLPGKRSQLRQRRPALARNALLNVLVGSILPGKASSHEETAAHLDEVLDLTQSTDYGAPVH